MKQHFYTRPTDQADRARASFKVVRLQLFMPLPPNGNGLNLRIQGLVS